MGSRAYQEPPASHATSKAPSTLDEVKKLLAKDEKVKLAGIDVDGVLRGKVRGAMIH